MDTVLTEQAKKALISSLYRRTKNQVTSLVYKRRTIVSRLTKRSDAVKIERIRNQLLNQ